ncbi:hypothetical protein GS399_02575 [Pedobacter sp. HMF7647]|uniref:Uncharacterized protein n=1 Tax=Hufsiella arboris TaxID=2695275 RepID=A0A7K1Y5X2_9SPHI|nr:hypothetical protein [Hufsiella arboris]MXV49840.1 hypothetical protein [Hufsiella arboris]
MNKLILRFVFLFRPVFERFGADADQLYTILEVKLKMDDRRPNMYMGNRQRQKKEPKNSSFMAMLMLLLLGLFMTIILATLQGALIGQAFYFAMFMAIISLTLIADFTSVLIDVRDNYILLPRPINDVTITLSRILHIGIHIAKLVISLTLPALLYVVFTKGFIALLAFLIEIFSASSITILLVNMVYLLVLKVTSPNRFKDFISYFQIIFAIVVFAAYQLLPRMMNQFRLVHIDVLSYKWTCFLPPVWFASFYDILIYPQTFSYLKLGLSIIGLISPFIGLFLVVKVFAPGFNKKLSEISGSTDEKLLKKGGSQSGKSWISDLAKKVTNDPVEYAGFKLTWWLTSRYRDFKVKVYPAFAYVPVYFVYFFISRKSSGFDNMVQGKAYLFLVYLSSFVLMTTLNQVPISERYKAAWVMFSTPHNSPGKIMAGMYKALLIKYLLPFFLVISAFCIYTWGSEVINDLVLAFFNISGYGIIMALFTIKYLPFSQPVNVQAQGGKFMANFLVMILIAIIGFVHYGLSRWEWAINIMTLLSAGTCWALFHYYRNRNWQALEADYS